MRWTNIYAPTLLAVDAFRRIDDNVRFTVDIVACVIKYFIDIYHSALQAVQTVEIRSFMLTFSFVRIWLSTSMVMFFFGSPVMW